MRKNIGLALGGGAVLGAAHIGVLQALEELEIQIDYIAGTSIGALVGALLAFGKNSQEIQKVFHELNWVKAADLSLSRFGLLSNQKLGDALSSVIGDAKFDDTLLPLSVVAVDIASGDKVILNTGDVAQAVMASTSIPGIFHPVEINGRMLVDGGVIENLPVETVKDMGADMVIAVNLTTSLKKPKNIVDILVNVLHIAILHNKVEQYDDADVIIELKLSDYNRVDTKQINALISEGYQQAKPILTESLSKIR